MEVRRNSRLGRLGEDTACDFLLSRGHRILDRNWRGGHLEIDIVSEGADGLHFVEVKSRTAPVLSSLDDQVNETKQKRMSAAALKYLNVNHLEGQEVFFDVVSVVFDGPETRLRYFPHAWIPMYL